MNTKTSLIPMSTHWLF